MDFRPSFHEMKCYYHHVGGERGRIFGLSLGVVCFDCGALEICLLVRYAPTIKNSIENSPVVSHFVRGCENKCEINLTPSQNSSSQAGLHWNF